MKVPFLISLPKTVQLQSDRALTEPGGLHRTRERQQQPGDDQALQARIIQLEGQVHHRGHLKLLGSLQGLTFSCVLPPR